MFSSSFYSPYRGLGGEIFLPHPPQSPLSKWRGGGYRGVRKTVTPWPPKGGKEGNKKKSKKKIRYQDEKIKISDN